VEVLLDPHACGLIEQFGRCAARGGGVIRALGRPCGAHVHIVMPPSHEYTLPVTKADSSDARKTTSGAISSALASRPIGCRAMNILRASSGFANAPIRSCSDGVSTVPGAIALQRIPFCT